MTWFGSVLRDLGFKAGDTDPAEYARAVADNAVLDSFTAAMDRGGLVEGAIPPRVNSATQHCWPEP